MLFLAGAESHCQRSQPGQAHCLEALTDSAACGCPAKCMPLWLWVMQHQPNTLSLPWTFFGSYCRCTPAAATLPSPFAMPSSPPPLTCLCTLLLHTPSVHKRWRQDGRGCLPARGTSLTALLGSILPCESAVLLSPSKSDAPLSRHTAAHSRLSHPLCTLPAAAACVLPPPQGACLSPLSAWPRSRRATASAAQPGRSRVQQRTQASMGAPSMGASRTGASASCGQALLQHAGGGIGRRWSSTAE